ncbi:MAG: 3-oxoacyl-ACP reductase FabG [Spirochaetes bacterium]|nr:3-oxoacyl-ACP reductase FabG [Spirochaetota bacterium]
METRRKRALVTGGSRGIGKAICLMLAKNGFDLLLNYKSNDERANETQKEVEKYKVNCKILKFDIADFKYSFNLLNEEVEKNGNIDVLILNAGVRKDTLFPLMTEEDWNYIIDVNYKSFFYIVKPIINGMFHQNYGKIVVISSTAGLMGMQGQVNYSSSKFGIIGAAKSLAVEVARRNVNVNIIAPGYVETEMIEEEMKRKSELVKIVPARRFGTPDDIANVVEFLISDKSSYITGQVIPVNGGVYT